MIKKTAFVLAAIGLGVLLSVDPTPAKVEAQTDTATLVIELAPNPIFTPRELLFNKKT